jgi:putative oxidoreductase
MEKRFKIMAHLPDLGLLVLRLFAGFRLIYGVQDNVFSWDHMLAFRDFLQAHHFPWPLGAAMVSVYAQLLAGIGLVLGWQTRYAAGLMTFNFLVALVMVHRGQSVEAMTPALAMLFISISLLFQGPGRYALGRPAKAPGPEYRSDYYPER